MYMYIAHSIQHNKEINNYISSFMEGTFTGKDNLIIDSMHV